VRVRLRAQTLLICLLALSGLDRAEIQRAVVGGRCGSPPRQPYDFAQVSARHAG
jgi:hypothetical protein